MTVDASESYCKVLMSHYQSVWGAAGELRRWREGPTHELPVGFGVLEVPPHGERPLWTYATCCMSEQGDEAPLELHLFSPRRADELVELLTVIAHYHRTGARVGLHHTVNFGRPWLEQSKATFGLVSLPYLDGSKLEWLGEEGGSTRFLWLIPITERERDLKRDQGIEVLEQRMEASGFDYSSPERPSLA